MLPRTLVVLGVLLAAPLATATAPECARNPPHQQIYELKDGLYFFLGDSGTTGFWSESNDVTGLQTVTCMGGPFKIYDADQSRGPVLPADQLL